MRIWPSCFDFRLTVVIDAPRGPFGLGRWWASAVVFVTVLVQLKQPRELFGQHDPVDLTRLVGRLVGRRLSLAALAGLGLGRDQALGFAAERRDRVGVGRSGD